MLEAMPTQAEYDAMSDRELLVRANRFERDADGRTRPPELLAEFENFTEHGAEEWGAIEDPAAEAEFERLVRAEARKASVA